MKLIIKGTEPASFTQWKDSANENWTPTYASLQHPEKRDLHQSLLAEQNSCCCYCGQEIDLSTSHIEHFRPQEHFDLLALDYQNLHASCLRETKPGNPLHCGHRKGNWFEEDLHISPMEDGCERRFRYLLTGEIQANEYEDAPASKMIDVLALDIAYLNNRREQAIRGIFDNDFLSEVSNEELEQLITGLRSLERGPQAQLSHVIARYAEQLLPS
jgi:uncharacterized protein (TIGR02646 family)